MILELEQRKIEFRLATSKDAQDMVDFHNSYYRTRRKPEHWLWEYETYEPEKAVFVFAKDHDKLIATQAMIPIYMQIGSECVLSGKSENTLLLPTYRGTAIMQSLYEYAVENCIDRRMQFIWGFTDAVKAFRKFGFTCYPDIQMMVRPGNIWVAIIARLKTKTPLWRRIGSTGTLILNPTLIKGGKTIPQIQKKAGYEIKRGEICDQCCLEELYKRLKLKHKNLVSIKYDQKYLRWRVREHPLIKYNEYQAYQGDTLRAYALVALFEGVASISDLTSEDRYATSLLLDTILKDYAQKVGRFQFLGNPRDFLAQDVFGQLHHFGFSPYSNWNFVLRDLTRGKNEQIFDIRNWHINGLWTEGYSM